MRRAVPVATDRRAFEIYVRAKNIHGYTANPLGEDSNKC